MNGYEMSDSKKSILVFGATGQQGGSVATALLRAGWTVRAFVRDVKSAKSLALIAAGAELAQGEFSDTNSMRTAMQGVYGVFSVQPSSGMGPELGLSDEEEERYGMLIADLAVETGVNHLIYTSGGAVGEQLTGMGHFDSKARIEAHIRTLPITATIVRPAAFMEMLVMPGFGLDEGRYNFFVRPDQSIQLIAVEDIGKIVAVLFSDPTRFGGATIDIASDTVNGAELGAALSKAAGRPITYARFTDEVLASNQFLAALTKLVDDGPLAGKADLTTLLKIEPNLQTFRSWLSTTGQEALQRALGTAGKWGRSDDQ